MKYKWPLSVSSFSIWDKLQVAWFILSSDRYTMGENVKELEWQLSEKTCYNENKLPYCLLTSSGSGAISLLFDTWKQLNKDKFLDTTVIAPAVTWSTSISIPILAGYKVKLCDINLDDLSFNYEKLERAIKQEQLQNRHIILWPTSLLGFVPNINRLRFLAKEHNCDLWMDCAENTVGEFENESILSSCDNTITSMYFSHHLQAAGELGALFTKDKHFYETASMVRCHGQTKVLDDSSKLKQKFESGNPTIDKRFLFGVLGYNLRPIEICSLFTLLDMKRWEEYQIRRVILWNAFFRGLNKELFYIPSYMNEPNVPFAICLFAKSKDIYNRAKQICETGGVETRCVVGSNLLRQPAFKHLGDYRRFPNAELIHQQAFYIGLHPKLKEEQVVKLTERLNDL